MFRIKYFQLILFISTILSIKFCHGVVYPIGSVFDRNKLINTVVLEHAIGKANIVTLKDSNIELKHLSGKIDYANEFIVAESVCELLGEGSLAIFGPKAPAPAAHASSICDAKEIPYIDTYMELDTETKSSNINFYPSLSAHSQLLLDVVNMSGWQDFTVLYEAPHYIKRVAPLLEQKVNQGLITVQPLEIGTNFRRFLRKVKDLGSRSMNILIECSIEHLSEILEQALQVGLFTADRSFIITNLDAPSIDLTPYQYTEANIVLFRIVQPEEPYPELEGIREALENAKDECQYCTPEEIQELSPEIHQTSTALIFDAVMTLAEALKQIGSDHLRDSITSISCYNTESAWSKGYTVMNFMRSTNYTGLSGIVEFDTKGVRSNVRIDIMSLKSDGIKNVGYFKATDDPRLTIFPQEEESISSDDLPINEMKFIVIIALSDPYVMLKDTSTGLSGNDRYEGFGIDIIDELAQMYGFKYEFVLQENGKYGEPIPGTNGEWNGMMGEVMAGRADLAVTDLTINSARITALDFTPSFMNLGIALLYRKPMQEPPSTFSFMSPFSSIVWIYLGAAYIAVSLCFFCLGRISPSQWENRFPCVEDPEFLENQFTLNNSMWFAIGALLQQGSEIEPKAASIRLASSVWWFFTLIMVSSYTANLAAFLVIENKSSKISSVDDLNDCGVEGKECPVTFGAKRGGATLDFFRVSTNPLYQNMYKYMMANPDVLTSGNKEGVDRVYAGVEDYAFLMESASIQYETERKCNLTQVGDELDDKNYGIGMRKNFKYHAQMAEGVLRLQESGTLAELKKKWWKERKGGGACSKDEGGDAEELTMDNLRGVFLVLIVGGIFACFYGFGEAFIIMYGRAKKGKMSFKEALMREIRFLMTCQDVKTLQSRKSSKSQNSGQSSRSNRSRYSPGSVSQIHGSNRLLNLD